MRDRLARLGRFPQLLKLFDRGRREPVMIIHVLVSVLKLVRQAIYLVGKVVEQSAAGITRSYVFNDRLADWHPHPFVAGWGSGGHDFKASRLHSRFIQRSNQRVAELRVFRM